MNEFIIPKPPNISLLLAGLADVRKKLQSPFVYIVKNQTPSRIRNVVACNQNHHEKGFDDT